MVTRAKAGPNERPRRARRRGEPDAVRGEPDDMVSLGVEKRIGGNDHGRRTGLAHGGEGDIDIRRTLRRMRRYLERKTRCDAPKSPSGRSRSIDSSGSR